VSRVVHTAEDPEWNDIIRVTLILPDPPHFMPNISANLIYNNLRPFFKFSEKKKIVIQPKVVGIPVFTTSVQYDESQLLHKQKIGDKPC
jgi:hypothetical protein